CHRGSQGRTTKPERYLHAAGSSNRQTPESQMAGGMHPGPVVELQAVPSAAALRHVPEGVPLHMADDVQPVKVALTVSRPQVSPACARTIFLQTAPMQKSPPAARSQVFGLAVQELPAVSGD